MSLWNRVRDSLRSTPPAPPPPTLRSTPGGLAWINSKVDEGCGTGAMVNRVVRTVHVMEDDFWMIDPPQEYVCTHTMRNAMTGAWGFPGDRCRVIAIRDGSLTPIPQVGDEDRTEERTFQPPVPTSTKVPKGIPA